MSEKNEARRDGAKLQPNSGRGEFKKGDATTKTLLIDYKEVARSFTLNHKVWGKVSTDAAKVDINLMPALKIILGVANAKVRLAVSEWSFFEQAVEAYEYLHSTEFEELKEKAWRYDRLQ